ncbi:MAG: hypothetical protein A2297_04200 [Elusimicrobia bacterium RIFOXYB2_FULL_48_7]|nr:MAG: hypothetical protein A2297_04200 [Elusimicrobia bacterium RIFOXYB2_FULL_48_7]
MPLRSFLKKQISKLLPGKKKDAVPADGSVSSTVPAQQGSQQSNASGSSSYRGRRRFFRPRPRQGQGENERQRDGQAGRGGQQGGRSGQGRGRFSRQQRTRKPQRNNYAFIDSQNLNLSIRSQNWILDFRRFRVYLKQKYSVTKAFIFIGQMEANQNLYDALKNFGYLLVYKPTVSLSDGTVKGNIDAELVLHAMLEFKNYDKAVIVTSDGDFYCLVDYLKSQNKLEKLIVPYSRRYSSLLQKFRNDTLFMDGLRNVLRYKSRKPPAADAGKTETTKP